MKILGYTPPAFFLHHRPQNLGRNAKKRQKCNKKKQKLKKIAEMQKKSRKCTFDSKINAKKGHKFKKRQKIHFQFRNSYKKISKREKRKHIYLDFFAFISLVHFFCILNLKIHIKKDKNA